MRQPQTDSAMRIIRAASYMATYAIVIIALLLIPVAGFAAWIASGNFWVGTAASLAAIAAFAIFGRTIWSPYTYVRAAEIAAVELFGLIGPTTRSSKLMLVPLGARIIRIPAITDEIREPIDDVKSSDGFDVLVEPDTQVRAGDVRTIISHLGEGLSYTEIKQRLHDLAEDEIAEITRDLINSRKASTLHRMKANQLAKLVEVKLDEPNPQWGGLTFTEHFGFDSQSTVSFKKLVVPGFAEASSRRVSQRLQAVADREQAMENAGLDPDSDEDTRKWRRLSTEEKIRLTNMAENRTSETVEKHVYDVGGDLSGMLGSLASQFLSSRLGEDKLTEERIAEAIRNGEIDADELSRMLAEDGK